MSTPLYLRERDLVGVREVTAEQAAANRQRGKGPRRPRRGVPGILPVSSTTLWRFVRDGRFPAPLKLGARLTAWRWEDVQAWKQAALG